MFNIRFEEFNDEEKGRITAASKKAVEMSDKANAGATAAATPHPVNEERRRIREYFGNGTDTPQEVAKGVRKMDEFLKNDRNGRDGPNTVTFVDFRRKATRSADGNVRHPMSTCTYAQVLMLRGTDTAHVGSGIRVYLGEQFFNRATGLLERAATIYHEIAHKILDVRDYKGGYGWDECRELARNCPQAALDNAENWAYYAYSFTPSGAR